MTVITEEAHVSALAMRAAPRQANWGEEGELEVVRWLRDDLGLHVSHQPATPTFDSDTGQRIEPDLAMRLGTGAPTYRLQDGPVDTLGEVKVQTAPGSVIDKLPETITRYSRLFHDTGVPAVVFYRLSPGAASDALLDRYARLARAHLIGFVPIGSVTALELRALVSDLIRRRHKLIGDDTAVLDLVGSYSAEMLTRAAQLAVQHASPFHPAR